MPRERAQVETARAAHFGRIELIGPPGVGKSTIARHLVASGEFRRLPKVAADDVAPPSGTFPSFEALLKERGLARFLRAHAASIDMRIEMLRRSRLAAPGRIFVDDEGLLQRGFNLAQLKPDPELFAQYLCAVPAPDAVVVVRADPAEIAERNRRRGLASPHRDSGKHAFFLSWVADIAASVLSARGVPCVMVENDRTPDAVATQIIEAVRRLRGL